jgi:hypothetical protein
MLKRMWFAASLLVPMMAPAQAVEVKAASTCHQRQLEQIRERNESCPACAVSASGVAEAATNVLVGTNVASLLDPSCRNFLTYVEPSRDWIDETYAYVPGGSLPAKGSAGVITAGMKPDFNFNWAEFQQGWNGIYGSSPWGAAM